MIVIDASMIAPMILLDERPPPADVAAELTADSLAAPAHWPVETANLMLVARRRGRLDGPAWEQAFGEIRALRVDVAAPPDWRTIRSVAGLAETHRLTLYDAAYLHQAVASSATLATLDRALVHAAREAGVAVLTYP